MSESDILSYGDELEARVELTKMATFVSKGGGITAQIQFPLEGKVASLLADHIGHHAKIHMWFSSHKAEDEKPKKGGKPVVQGTLFGGPTATPAPGEEVHQAGEELISSTCPSCGGNCYRGENNEDPCEECGATGVVYRKPNTDTRVDCPTCKGTGNVEGLDLVWGPCTDCHGTGKVEAKEAPEVVEPVPMFIVVDDKGEFLTETPGGEWDWTPDRAEALEMNAEVAAEAVNECGGTVEPAQQDAAEEMPETVEHFPEETPDQSA